MKRLEQLRGHIRQLDEDILRLIAARMAAAKAIGQQKKMEGIPLRDWNVERQVLDRAACHATDFGLPPAVARAVMQTLIAAARAEQERTSFSTYRGSAESILIIGGRGKMGRWFADFFGDQGHRVSVYDVAGNGDGAASAPTLEAALDGTSFALIAAPLDVVPGVIAQLAETGYGGTVFDVASLKEHLKPAIARARTANLSVASIHPMFGPGTRTLADQVICICDCGDAHAARRVEAFFIDTAATLVRLSLEEHDQVISYVLGLSHLTNLVFAKVLMESGRSYQELNKAGSTTFHSQMMTTATVIQENPELYYTIQQLNPFSAELCEAYRGALEAISGWIRNEDRPAFVEMMQAGRKWMVGDDAG
jgi:chorismate mutase/prephenate dehydrogenase